MIQLYIFISRASFNFKYVNSFKKEEYITNSNPYKLGMVILMSKIDFKEPNRYISYFIMLKRPYSHKTKPL